MNDKEFLEMILKEVVMHPEDVVVERSVDEMGVLLTVNINPDDMGKVIGRSGNTAKAIRTLLRIIGMKNQARVNMKIIEPPRPEVSEQAPQYGLDDMDKALENL